MAHPFQGNAAPRRVIRPHKKQKYKKQKTKNQEKENKKQKTKKKKIKNKKQRKKPVHRFFFFVFLKD